MSVALPRSNLANMVVRGLGNRDSLIGKVQEILFFFPDVGDIDDVTYKAMRGEQLRGDYHILALPNYRGEVDKYKTEMAPWHPLSFDTLRVSKLSVGDSYQHKDIYEQDPWEMVVVANELRQEDGRTDYFFVAVKSELLSQH